MNYELAKELNDAGFPQTEGAYICRHRLWENMHGSPCECGEGFYTPTLEELINALGEDFDYLYRTFRGQWCAFCKLRGVFLPLAASPLEAVANLWLAINKHEEPSTDKENG